MRGSGLDQCQRLCQDYPTRAKWIVAPNHALGHTLGERLAREGTGWANLRFTPPLDLALRMAAPYLVERGIDPAPDGVGPALITRLLLDLPAATPAYFRPLAEQPRMADALWAAIRELRMAGVRAAALPRAAFASPAKHAELRALLRAYEAHLADRGLADTALVYEEALRHPDACPIRGDDLLLEWPEVVWAPLERRFLDALPGIRVTARALAVPGLERPRRLARLGAPVELIAPGAAASDRSGAPGAEARSGAGDSTGGGGTGIRASPGASLTGGASPGGGATGGGSPGSGGSGAASPGGSRTDGSAGGSSTGGSSTGGQPPGGGSPGAGSRAAPEPPAGRAPGLAPAEAAARQVSGAGSDAAREPAAPGDAEAAPLTDARRLAWLLRPDAAPPPRGDGTVTLFRAGGRQAELEEVFRRILASGRPLDDVELACAAAADTTLAWELAQRHEWPVTVEPGIPVARTRPGRALLAFAAWVEGGFRADELRRLLQSGDLRLDLADGPSPGQAARLLARAGATWGRATYAAALGELAAADRARAGDPETDDAARAYAAARAARAARLADRLAALLALAPEPDPRGAVPVGAAVAGARALVTGFAAVTSDLDGAAAVVLDDALAELDVLGDLARPLADVLALVRDRVEGLAVGGDRARPGCLHVTTLDRAGSAGRPLTFVTGLEEGRVLPPLLEDPVLLDAERQAISPDLATSGDHVAEALHRIVGRLAALGGRVCLSYSGRDLREGRETFPSWLVLQALRLAEPGRLLTYEDLEARLGEPVSAVPASADRALDDAGWWLATLRTRPAAGRARLRAAFPALARGDAAEQTRESVAFTEFDGWVPEAAPALDFTGPGRVVSATALEDLAGCPFRHFLRRVLGIEPLDVEAPDPDAWLDPLTRGSLLHALYAEIVGEARATGERLDPRRHGPRLRALGETSLAELRRLRPPPSELVYEREAEAFRRDLDLFLRLEAAAGDRTPVGLEVAFGGAPGEADPLARATPVTLDLGPDLRLRLRGRIDRIDRLPDGRYQVVDYKTGVPWGAGGDAPFEGGRRLQHALYALAAARLLRKRDPRATVASASYYYPTVRGRGERLVLPQDGPDGVRAVLADLLALVRAGAFVHAPDEADCRFCDLGRACGPDAAARAARKVDAGGSPALEPFRRLRAHA